MTVKKLRDILDQVDDEDSEVFIGKEGDMFDDALPVTNTYIIKEFPHIDTSQFSSFSSRETLIIRSGKK